jgi:hypothetical protein
MGTSMARPHPQVIPRKVVNTQGHTLVALGSKGINAATEEKPLIKAEASPVRVNWRVPIVMAWSLPLGIMSAVGHLV